MHGWCRRRSRQAACSYKNYCSLNIIGTVYLVLTVLPACLPAVHAGIALTTLRASLSRDALPSAMPFFLVNRYFLFLYERTDGRQI